MYLTGITKFAFFINLKRRAIEAGLALWGALISLRRLVIDAEINSYRKRFS